MLFEPGPWDNKEKTEGVHVFSKKRKLMYGSEHDHGNEGDEDYGKKELHQKHPMWRRNALKYLQSLAARTTGEVRLERKVPRWNHKEGSVHVTGWPGDLGKDYNLVEEMVQIGVISIHQNDDQTVHAIVHRGALHKAAERFCTEPAGTVPGAAAGSGAAATGPVPEFESASSFQGRRPGAVFKLGEAGLGYYRDGAQPEPEPEPLPPDWTQGTTPEGYTYYWHTPTSTSTWERPTAATQLVQVVPLSAEAVAALRGAGPSALAKLQQASGAHIALKAGQAAVSGTARAIAEAATLLRRKADGLIYAARALPSARPAASAASGSAQTAPDYNFKSVVAQHDAATAAGGGGAGALAALAAYDDDDDDE